MKKIQDLFKELSNSIQMVLRTANLLIKKKHNWLIIGNEFLKLVSTFFSDINEDKLVFAKWTELDKDLNLELKAMWKFALCSQWRSYMSWMSTII